MRSAPMRSDKDQGEAGRTGALLRTYAVPEAAAPAKAIAMANNVLRQDPSRPSVVPPPKAEEIEDLVGYRRGQRHLVERVGPAGHVVGIGEVGDPLVDAAELRVPPLPGHVLAAVAEGIGAGDGDQRASAPEAPQREPDSGVGVATQGEAAGRFGAGQGHFLRALYAFRARRADRAVELPSGRLAAQPRERLARLLRAAIELLHPLVAEAERRREVEPAALGRSGRGQVGAVQPEDPPDGGSHLVGALARAHRAEAVLHGVPVERLAVRGAQAPADLPRGEDRLAADQRLGQQLE